MMEYLPLIGTVSLLNLLAAVSPGPDFVMIVKNSLCYSRKTGIFTAIGIGLGLCVHLAYCAAGIAIIISKFDVVFSIIKFLGAGYLIYIGLTSIFAKNSKLDLTTERPVDDLTFMQAFKMGFFTNILNPKVTLFFLSLFTFVISPTTPTYIVLFLSFIMVMTAFVWFTIVSIFFTQQKVQKAFLRFEKPINRFMGSLLVILGIKIALTFK